MHFFFKCKNFLNFAKSYSLRHFLSTFSQICLPKGSNFRCRLALLKGGVWNLEMAHLYTKIMEEPPIPVIAMEWPFPHVFSFLSFKSFKRARDMWKWSFHGNYIGPHVHWRFIVRRAVSSGPMVKHYCHGLTVSIYLSLVHRWRNWWCWSVKLSAQCKMFSLHENPFKWKWYENDNNVGPQVH